MKKKPVVSKKSISTSQKSKPIPKEKPVIPPSASLPLVDEFPEVPSVKPPKDSSSPPETQQHETDRVPDKEPEQKKEPSLFERKVEKLRVQFGQSEAMHSEKQINAALNLRIIELLEEIRDGLHSS